MDNEKNLDYQGKVEAEGNETPAAPGGQAPRARNRTVMLTPEITGEVRARIARDFQDPAAGRHNPPPAESKPPQGPFHGGMYNPAGNRPHAPAEPEPDRAPSPPVFGGQSQGGAPRLGYQSQPAVPVKGDRVVWTQDTRLIGFLVSYDRKPSGESFELRSGRLIVTSEVASTGNALILVDETVSPMHAILRVAPTGEIQLLDQLSEHGTKIKRASTGEEEDLSGDKSILEHGDIVRFGSRKFHVCLVVGDGEG